MEDQREKENKGKGENKRIRRTLKRGPNGLFTMASKFKARDWAHAGCMPELRPEP
jgi:hypothetical protein